MLGELFGMRFNSTGWFSGWNPNLLMAAGRRSTCTNGAYDKHNHASMWTTDEGNTVGDGLTVRVGYRRVTPGTNSAKSARTSIRVDPFDA